MTQRLSFLPILFLLLISISPAQDRTPYDSVAVKIVTTALGENSSIGTLTDLCTTVGARVSGSPQAARAVEWGRKIMEKYGFQNVHLEPVMVPHWVRGPVEEATYAVEGGKEGVRLHIAALGGSVGTPKEGLRGEVVEIRSWEELKKIGSALKGKIAFFSRPMDRTLLTTGQAYGRAVDQRSRGPMEAGRCGAVAAFVRSMTTRMDDVPHTGATDYNDTVPKIPAAAVSTNDAERLSTLLRAGTSVTATLRLSCEILPDAESANVVGELTGTEKPNEIIVVGGHLDSWDKGQGAHDDGAGIVHAIEAAHLLKDLGLAPKRTIRVVLFINEENGLRGGIAYAAVKRPGEKHIAAVESDAGGFMPRGFGVSDSAAWVKLSAFAPAFRPFSADRIVRGGGGADISPLGRTGVPTIGLNVDGQRYFDYHHSDNDTIDKVNERELAYGTATTAILLYILAQEGL